MTYTVTRPGDLAQTCGSRAVELPISERDFRTHVLPWIVDQNLGLTNWEIHRDDDHTLLYADCVVLIVFMSSGDARLCRERWIGLGTDHRSRSLN